MLSLQKPSAEVIRRFISGQAKRDFTYAAVGATAGTPPPAYVVDHTRIKLGEGEQVYEAAKSAIRRWDQFRLGWLEAIPVESSLQQGGVVVVVAHVFGFWWLNACRIVFVIDEAGERNRFGVAYGTLPDHAAKGEERFLVEWNRSDNSVWYDILAFSRPNHVLTWLGYPVVRRTQKRFGRESSAAMQRAVKASAPGRPLR